MNLPEQASRKTVTTYDFPEGHGPEAVCTIAQRFNRYVLTRVVITETDGETATTQDVQVYGRAIQKDGALRQVTSFYNHDVSREFLGQHYARKAVQA